MLNIKSITLLCLISSSLFAVDTDRYYKEAKTLKGFSLKTKLKNIISAKHRDRGYSALYDYYFQSDADHYLEADGSILDIYSENPNGKDPYTYSNRSHQCGMYKAEGHCFNREHLFPQGVFKKAYPMRSDFFHVFPTDGYVNNKRGRLPFGEVCSAKWKSLNGSKRGKNCLGKYKGEVFEPIDMFKGDVARAMLYFATRYEDKVYRWSHPMLNGTKEQVYTDWFIKILLKWHKQDPVSKHEKIRNEYGYAFQGNRNPFIDKPEFVEKIWQIKK
ncbi:MAG: endonuclease [Bacteriovoracaceae bacterium]|jgi:endonuclease I|nr:endonuclease [Bacteriovoracaceae bacterium]